MTRVRDDDELMRLLADRLSHFRHPVGNTLLERLDAFYDYGGDPLREIKLAEQRAAKLAGDEEAAIWLKALLGARPQIDERLLALVDSWIRKLQGRLGKSGTPDEARAQTREHVRRHHARKRSPA
jgi:hypothetical protein